MTSEDHSERPWLLDLATPQRGHVEPVPGADYDEATQMTHLHEPHILDYRHRPQDSDKEG